MTWFEEYREDFEKALVIGMDRNLLGIRWKQVPVTQGRLSKRKIAKVLGKQINTGRVLVVDYYGYMKKSKGFSKMMKGVITSFKGKQLKTIEVPVVHFNSVRLEILAKIAPELIEDFSKFKKTILDARGFNHNYQA
jgi:hypothetical protein